MQIPKKAEVVKNPPGFFVVVCPAWAQSIVLKK